MAENSWSLRDLYQAAEVSGPHPLEEAQTALDEAVEAAYGKPGDQEATEFLLEMTLALAEDEAAGETIQGPGLPRVNGEELDPKGSLGGVDLDAHLEATSALGPTVAPNAAGTRTMVPPIGARTSVVLKTSHVFGGAHAAVVLRCVS